MASRAHKKGSKAGHIDLFEGGAAKDFSNAQLSNIFDMEKPAPFLTIEGNLTQYPKFLNTFDFTDKAPKPAKPHKNTVLYGNDNVKVVNDFAKDPGTTDIPFTWKDGNMADVVKMLSKNVDALGKDVKFLAPPVVERLRPAFTENIEELLRTSLQEKAMSREALFRDALLSMGLTEAEVRAAETAEKVRQATAAAAANQAEQFALRQRQLGLNEAGVRARIEQERERARNDALNRGRRLAGQRVAAAVGGAIQRGLFRRAAAPPMDAAPALAAAVPAIPRAAMAMPMALPVEGMGAGAGAGPGARLAEARIAEALARGVERPAGGAGAGAARRPMIEIVEGAAMPVVAEAVVGGAGGARAGAGRKPLVPYSAGTPQRAEYDRLIAQLKRENPRQTSTQRREEAIRIISGK